MKKLNKTLGGAVSGLGGPYVVLGALAVAGAAWFYFKGEGDSVPERVGAGLASAAVDLASGVVAGTAYGIGDKLGVPRTDKTECQKAIEEGRRWDASFACPAGDFIKSFF